MKRIYTPNQHGERRRPLHWPRIAVTLAIATVVAGPVQARVMKADFNGDGLEDLVVGVPSNDTGGRRGAGAVSVFYGGDSGIPRNASRSFTQDTPGDGDSPGIAGAAETDDNFGAELAVGDFNNDGFTDLAVGVPFEDVPGIGEDRKGENAGAVNIIYGSASGLDTRANHMLSLGLLPPPLSQSGAQFGQTLASGDLNGDGFADLIVGAPFWDHVAAGENVGAVWVYFGGDEGLAHGQGTHINQNVSFVPGESKPGDRFGSSLTVADFNRDGVDDLVIGVPEKDIGDFTDTGMVVMLMGSPFGGFSTEAFSFVDVPLKSRDQFGRSLAAGDFDGDGHTDLAVGNPLDDTRATNSGAVKVFFNNGAAPGFVTRHQLWLNLPDPEEADYFGRTLAAADFDGNGVDDLAIGTPGEDQELRFRFPRRGVGDVFVLYGAAGRGLTITRRSHWNQDKDGVQDSRESSDSFGAALSYGDFNHDGIADLVVGVPNEDVDTGRNQEDAGIVHVFYGTLQGLSSHPDLGAEVLSEGIGTVGPAARADDRFGSALP